MNFENDFDKGLRKKVCQGWSSSNCPQWDKSRVWAKINAVKSSRKWIVFTRMMALAAGFTLFFLCFPIWQEVRNGFQTSLKSYLTMDLRFSDLYSADCEPEIMKSGVSENESIKTNLTNKPSPTIVKSVQSNKKAVAVFAAVAPLPQKKREVFLNSLHPDSRKEIDINPILAVRKTPLSGSSAKVVLKVPVMEENRQPAPSRGFFTNLVRQVKHFNNEGSFDFGAFNIEADDNYTFSIYKVERDTTYSAGVDF